MTTTAQAQPLGPDSLVWQLGGDWTALLGGGRALILQVAHPVVATGIDQFSDYRHNPWQRLVGTLDLYLRTVFGGQEDAARAGADLRALHRRINGYDADGNRYHALAPEPFAWVHATLVDSLIEMIDRFRRPLAHAEKEQIYAEMGRVGCLYGLRPRDLPASWAGFEAYRDDMIAHRIVVGETLREVMESVLRLPAPPTVPLPEPAWRVMSWPGAQLSSLITLGTLPAALRDRLGVSWTSRQERALRVAEAAISRTLPRLPGRLRLMPPAYGAIRRAGASARP
jgi:uncharacterized protein (DUF2236 family)